MMTRLTLWSPIHGTSARLDGLAQLGLGQLGRYPLGANPRRAQRVSAPGAAARP
jgi:hypothetical protein